MKTSHATLAVAREPAAANNFRTLTLVVCVGMGLLFVVLGVLKIVLPPPEYAREVLGDARWAHILLGMVEVAGGLLLLWPRTVTLGAGVMAVFIGTLLGMSLLQGNRSPGLLIPVMFLLGVVLIGYLRHPGRLAVTRLQSVLDRYADQQLSNDRRKR